MKYEDLAVWKKSFLLVKEIYQESKNFPGEVGKMQSGLSSSLQRQSDHDQ